MSVLGSTSFVLVGHGAGYIQGPPYPPGPVSLSPAPLLGKNHFQHFDIGLRDLERADGQAHHLYLVGGWCGGPMGGKQGDQGAGKIQKTMILFTRAMLFVGMAVGGSCGGPF